jgi:DNA-binding NarL/FixJ family response regulator
VLIADDDARVRRALRLFIELDPSFMVVGEAGSAAEVLERDRTLRPTVILLDLLFPAMEDGLALLRRLAHRQGRPVVAISMRDGLRTVALRAGARAFLGKGEPPDLILHALRAVAEESPPPH